MYGRHRSDELLQSEEWQKQFATHQQRAKQLLVTNETTTSLSHNNNDDDGNDGINGSPSLFHSHTKRVTAPPSPAPSNPAPTKTKVTNNQKRARSVFDLLMSTTNNKNNNKENEIINNKNNNNNKKRKKSSSSCSSLSSSSSGQYHLDFGQSPLGVEPCSECGQVYQRGDPEDEKHHSQQHDKYVNGFLFDGWKNEPVVKNNNNNNNNTTGNDRILRLNHQNVKGREQNVRLWLERLYTELGGNYRHQYKNQTSTSSNNNSNNNNNNNNDLLSIDESLYVYIRDRRIVGLMMVKENVESQQIMQTSKITTSTTSPSSLPSLSSSPLPLSSTSISPPQINIHSPIILSPLGIDRIWVLKSVRHTKIATRLLDSCLEHFTGLLLKRSELSFSQPTNDGRKLSEYFTGSEIFQIY